MARDVRISIFKGDMSTCYTRDAHADCAGQRLVYDAMTQAPYSGCGTATIGLGLYLDQVEALGYWSEFNIVEISTGDDTLRHPISTAVSMAEATAGAVARIYVADTRPYDPARNIATARLYITDQNFGSEILGTESGDELATESGMLLGTEGGLIGLTMGLDVVNVSTDATGPYCAVKAPAAMPGNPTTLDTTYAVGSVVGRRRYAGVIKRRERPHEVYPQGAIMCAPLSQAFAETNGIGWTITQPNIDITDAIYKGVLAPNAGEWPHLSVLAANFAAATGAFYTGSRQASSVDAGLQEMLSSVSTGDRWAVFVGHDRVVRLVRLYTQSSTTYTYALSLSNASSSFAARKLQWNDHDVSQFVNDQIVYGATNPATQQQYVGRAYDTTSIGIIGRRISGAPVTVTGLGSNDACAAYAEQLLNQRAIGTAQGSCRIHIMDRGQGYDTAPLGLNQGDVVLGFEGLTITGLPAGSPNVFGLVSSAQTTIDPSVGGDEYQDVTFAPVEPDWNEAVGQAIQAAATALAVNAGTKPSNAGFAVSASAFPPTISRTSLVVSVPAFLAIFAYGGNVVNVPASSFTLPANAHAFAWLDSSFNWTIETDPSVTHSGQIEYARFSTDASGVLGFDQIAPIGLNFVGGAQLANQVSTQPWNTNYTFHAIASASTITRWLDGGSDGVDITFTRVGASNVTAPHNGTSSSPVTVLTGLIAGDIGYGLIYYSLDANGTTATLHETWRKNAPFTLDEFAAAQADGCFAVQASVAATSIAQGSGGSTRNPGGRNYL